MSSRRALHFVFKIGDRNASFKFFREVLGMKVLRHEEFDSGCKASCNGPYDGKWSKTMIGYGPEDSYFVCELTYNYGISDYPMGNDFQGLYIQSSEAIERAKSLGIPFKQNGEEFALESPGGYKFFLINKPQPEGKDPVQKVAIASSKLEESVKYWRDLAEMTVYEEGPGFVSLGYSPKQTKLVLKDIGIKVNHAKAFGRIAFSCPAAQLKPIEALMKEKAKTILTPYVSLDTPGKATVEVVILADPDGHEICFVGDEGFRELSQVDPKGDDLLNEAIKNDKSDEWFAEKGGKGVAS